MSTSEERRLNEEDRQTLELLAGVLSEGVSRAAESEAKREQLDALARFEAIYEGALSGVLLISADGQVIDANPAMVQLLGLESAEQIERTFAHYLHPEDRATVLSKVRELLAGDGNSLRQQHRLVRADQQVIWISASLSIVRDLDGRPSFGILMIQDETERRRPRRRCCASPSSTSTRRCTTASPACPTGRCSGTASSRRSPWPGATEASSRRR